MARPNTMLKTYGLMILGVLAFAQPLWAIDWRPLPSPPEYRAMVDLDSVAVQQKFGRLLLRRAYPQGQAHASGKYYFSTRQHYVFDCTDGSAALAVTQYYGDDRKLTDSDVRKTLKRSEFTVPEPGGDIAEAVKLACERLAQGGKSDGEPPRRSESASPGKPLPSASSGSGIIVNRDGYVLTNQHVVNQCNTYEVIDDADRRLKASLHSVDTAKDLALLMVEERFAAVAPIRRDAAPRLGEAVTIVGFPLVNVLGTRPTVGFGHVSSTVGIRGNQSQMQISVPVQRGNSGGPVFDQAGNVIGVVVSKLDALKVAERMGDLPQNVNFAIRGDVVRGFLEANNVVFTASGDSAKLENTEIAARGAAATVRVRCLRTPAPATAPAPSQQ